MIHRTPVSPDIDLFFVTSLTKSRYIGAILKVIKSTVLIHVCAFVLGDDVVFGVVLKPRHTVAHQALVITVNVIDAL
jgi:hypothetical protein